MRHKLLSKFLLASAFFITLSVQGQNDRFGYAVTDSTKDGVKWNFLRKIDLRTGAFSSALLRLLNGSDIILNTFLCNGVAAIAHDKENKRLYYTPMLIDRLSYVDLKTMRTYVVKNNFTRLMPKAADQSNIITRMVIADDGYGYALTNDGRHLIRFSTRNNPAVTDLGSLVDAPQNNEVSVHNACSSFGGDLTADDEGNLYLITFRNHVFKINTRNKVAKFKGTITGLPENFSTSGAAVDQRGDKVIIVSSVNASDVYTLNIKRLEANGLEASNAWHTSDLASSNILKTERDDEHHPDVNNVPEILVNTDNLRNKNIQLYPNPVTSNEFKIQFVNTEAGNYTVQVMDAKGQVVLCKTVNTGGKNNIVPVGLPALTGKGIFIVRVTDNNNKTVFSEKIILQ